MTFFVIANANVCSDDKKTIGIAKLVAMKLWFRIHRKSKSKPSSNYVGS
jgi:hypothetical protein